MFKLLSAGTLVGSGDGTGNPGSGTVALRSSNYLSEDGLRNGAFGGEERAIHTLASILREQRARAIKTPSSLVGLGRAKELVARRLTRAILVRKAIAFRYCPDFDEPAI